MCVGYALCLSNTNKDSTHSETPPVSSGVLGRLTEQVCQHSGKLSIGESSQEKVSRNKKFLVIGKVRLGSEV